MIKKITITNLDSKQTSISTKPLLVCWGFFDGIHQGHQKLFNKVRTISKDKNYDSAVISFNVKPQTIVNDITNEILLNNDDKVALISKYSFDYYLEIIFTKAVATLSPQQFIAWLKALNVKAVVVSPHVRFGYQNAGTITDLEQAGLEVYLCSEIYSNDNTKISSTYVKKLVAKKDITKANFYLQPNLYTISGTVIAGRQEGRTLGFPTANLALTANYVLPGLATYITKTAVNNKWYQSMTVIMMRDNKPLVETYLLNFKQDIYGQVIKVRFLTFLRDNLQFTSLDALKTQLHIDLQNTIKYFANNK